MPTRKPHQILGPALNLAGGVLTTAAQWTGLGASPTGFIGSLQGGGTVTFKDAQFAGLDPDAFAAAVQAAGQSGSVDMAKVKSAVNAALSHGRLVVPEANAAITIVGGSVKVKQARLDAQGGAELSLDGGIDLTKASIDARMTLSAPPPAGAVLGTRPELAIAVKGPLGAPQRTLDLAPLTNWLTLNTAELQTRRIEAIEASQHVEAAGSRIHEAAPDTQLVQPGALIELPAPPAPARAVERLERLPQSQTQSIVPAQGRENSQIADHNTIADVPLPTPAPKARPSQSRTPPHASMPSPSPGEDTADKQQSRPAPQAPGPTNLTSRVKSILNSLFGLHQ